MTIANVTKADLPELSILFKEFIGVFSNLEKMSLSLDLMMQNQNYVVLGATINNEFVASAMGIICFDLVGECQPFMVIENVVVAKKFRGQGIGKELVRALEQKALAENCHYIMLVSSSSREGAHSFYRSLGYDVDVKGFKKIISKT